jgi:hypothetical protein
LLKQINQWSFSICPKKKNQDFSLGQLLAKGCLKLDAPVNNKSNRDHADAQPGSNTNSANISILRNPTNHNNTRTSRK